MSAKTVTVTMVALLLVGSTFAAAESAREIEGVEFAERVVVDGTPLVLKGVGLLRYKVLFKGYVAALYLGEGVDTSEIFADVPRRLEIEYFWSIDGSAFGKAGEEILAANVPPATMSALRQKLSSIDRLYPDVKPGDRLSLTYLPGKGTTLAWNGVPRGTIEGADFGADYYRIWLGARPMSESLRAQLLEEN